MNIRRVLALAVLVALLAAAGAALWRSAQDPHRDVAGRLASGLSCPSCAGETVADSRSPMAAAMRTTIDEQLAGGRTPEQVRDWFVQRYGPEIIADPPWSGIGALLWILPAVTLLAGLALAVRTATRPRSSSHTGAAHEPSTGTDEPAGGKDPAVTRRAWDVSALVLVGLVALVAVGAARTASEPNPAPPAERATSSPSGEVAERLARGSRLEAQAEFAAAAQAYGEAAELRDEPAIRLRQAFALLRAERAAEAARIARGVLVDLPEDPEALLVLGLAQRADGSPSATRTLRKFLKRAPEHPAAPDIRRLISG